MAGGNRRPRRGEPCLAKINVQVAFSVLSATVAGASWRLMEIHHYQRRSRLHGAFNEFSSDVQFNSLAALFPALAKKCKSLLHILVRQDSPSLLPSPRLCLCLCLVCVFVIVNIGVEHGDVALGMGMWRWRVAAAHAFTQVININAKCHVFALLLAKWSWPRIYRERVLFPQTNCLSV